MKKSFKLFLDSLDVLDELTDEQSGQLFKAIRAYEVDGSEILTGLMKAIFTPFKNNIDRAKSEYDAVCERNKANGLKGGRPNPNKPTGLKSNPNNPDKDKDKDKDKTLNVTIVPDKEIETIDGINALALEEWFKYKGSKYSKQGKTLSINFLKSYPEHIQLEIVRASIMNGWKGLFEPKQKQGTLQAQTLNTNINIWNEIEKGNIQ